MMIDRKCVGAVGSGKVKEDKKLASALEEVNDDVSLEPSSNTISSSSSSSSSSLDASSLFGNVFPADSMLNKVNPLDIKDIRVLCTLAESDDSQEQLRAMTLVNRSRMQVAKAFFKAIWQDNENKNMVTEKVNSKTPQMLSGKQEKFPFSYSHRNCVLIGSVISTP
jgi:hypothetical protein